MVRIPRSLALVGGFCTLLSATAAFAQSADTSTGLGQSWPNAADVSTSPHYHVYVFHKDGIRYFQVNDLNGNVRAAVAVANGVVLTLPIGLDAGDVTHSPTSPTSNASETVYNDKSMTLTATPRQDGHDAINTSTKTAADDTCEGQDCSVSSVSGQVVTPATAQSNSN
jgi:hypothetical protein